MIVLDTTVLVYAVGTEPALRGPSRSVLRAVASGRLQATTSVEAIQEFAHVRARRRGRGDAARLARAFRDLLAPLLPIAESDLDVGLGLWEQHPSLGAFDAVLAAAALGVGAQGVVSADQAFAQLAEPSFIPLSDAVDKLGLLAP